MWSCIVIFTFVITQSTCMLTPGCLSKDTMGRFLLSDDEHPRRVARDGAEHKIFGTKGNYITTVVYCDPPFLSDSISVGPMDDKTDKFSIQFNDVKFSKLSSAFAVVYRIDLDANVAQFALRLSKVNINGTYYLSTPSSPIKTYHSFEVNLFAGLIYMHNILFHIDEKGKAILRKTENPNLVYKIVKGHYSNAPSALVKDLNNYLSPTLLEAIVGKIHNEVRAKISFDDAALHIESENAFRHRSYIIDSIQKAMAVFFADVRLNSFNIFYYDHTNFKRIIQNFDVRIPTFILRNVDTFIEHDMKISFVDEDVRVKGEYRVASALAIMKAVYHNRNGPQAPNNSTLKAEYQFEDVFFKFEIILKPKSQTVQLENSGVQVTRVKVAPTQGIYGDERDSIIQQLTSAIKTFYQENGSQIYGNYFRGLVTDGEIAHEVFK